MADVTVLAELREQRRLRDSIAVERSGAGVCAPVAFYFDPCCPFSYLAAERVERRFSGLIHWVPVAAAALDAGEPWTDPRVARLLRTLAERRAHELRLPLVWPDHFRPSQPAVLRVAAYAAEMRVGSAFALAALRLAFCGGFDLADPLILAEAAAAAGVGIDACQHAAQSPAYDEPLESNACRLTTLGITQLPTFSVGARWFAGEARLDEASAWARVPVAVSRPG